MLLVQPRHVYAPESGTGRLGHIYMPTALLTVQARLLEAGLEAKFEDENLRLAKLDEPLIGINLIGAPYVSRARELCDRLAAIHREYGLVLGGQVVSGFNEQELLTLFGAAAINGNWDSSLMSRCSSRVKMPSPYDVSLVQAYSKLSDDDLTLYLNHEFCFFLSNGCKYACTFCAASHTRRDPVTNAVNHVREQYRSERALGADLAYLLRKAEELGVDTLQLYLSSLDLFQSPEPLKRFGEIVLAVRREHSRVKLAMRALSTVNSFLDVARTNPEIISLLVEAGLERIGFGVDGATAEVFKKTKKPQREPTSCGTAIRLARRNFNLTPETLMVFGHVGADTEQSMEAGYAFTKWALDEYGSLPRPHVAKSVIPGNEGWNDLRSHSLKSQLCRTPRLFQVLDFTALPTPLTHPDGDFRAIVEKSFLAVCSLPGAVTQYVLPEWPLDDLGKLNEARKFNLGRYDI